MTGYVLRPIVPVLVSTCAAILMLGGLSLLVPGGQIPMFFVHLVVLVLTAGAAYLLDDEAEPLTGVVPSSLLRRRTCIVLPGLAALAGGGAVLAAMVRWWAPSAPLPALAWETAGLAFLAVATSTVVARLGESAPGNLVTSAGGLLFVGVLVLQPMLQVTLLVTGPEDSTHGGWWMAVLVAATLTFVLSSHERVRLHHGVLVRGRREPDRRTAGSR